MLSGKAAARKRRRRERSLKRSPRVPPGRFVRHPRYGDRPILSAERWTEAQILRAYPGYRGASIFPETAIAADLTRQRYAFAPRRVYVDMAMRCRSCARWFLWFALEQKHWIEELGFYCDVQCHHCQDCRHTAHLLRDRRKAYDSLVAQEDKTRADWERLERLGTALWEAGEISRPETLLKSRMPKRLRRCL
ncbi:hypothetical protein LNKW23_09420 [Paralimibaculum aggregatum]|uniref:Probable zinc-binding domain-containing protein n=1 Tax=Paralimibaculum aggregatum TaxID=3036245 RepID=A0ABQ6LHW3_9RHOB|nr:zinc-ribbon domain containing protein [Limibaculum sp. NKW23]GMG81729.1 hypothetical protein LNKW23_09420 [Limibaculum sp. NKW23]